MNRRRLILLSIAFVVAAGTWRLVDTQLSKSPQVNIQQAPVVKEKPKVRILIADENLPAGSLVHIDALEWREWPASDDMEKTYILEGKADLNDLAGSVVRQGIRKGEPVVLGRLVKPGERGFLAAVLSPDMRAVSVPINAITGIAGFIFPGDRVDLILTHEQVREDDLFMTERTASETVMRNIRVLAVDQRSSDQTIEPEVAEIATLEVSPSQVELIMVSLRLGKLSLSLRGFTGDHTEIVAIEPNTVSWDSDASRIVPPPANKAAMFRIVRVLRGSAEPVEVSFLRGIHK